MTKAKDLLTVLTVPIIFLLYALYTISDYGISWDEPYHFRRGQAFLNFFLTGSKTYQNMPKYPPLKGDSDSGDFRNSQKYFTRVQENPALSNPNFRRSYYQDDAFNGEYHIDVEKPSGHPAINDVLSSFSNYIFYQKLGILGDLESYQLFTISIVSFTTFFIAIFMWKNFGLLESIFSSLAFASYPLILGQQHFNIKDPPETSFYTIFVLTAFMGIVRNNIVWLLLATISFAFAFSTKFNIVFSVIPLSLWLIYYITKLSDRLLKEKLLKKMGIVLLIGPIIVLGVFLVSFPTLWMNPISGFAEIVGYYLKVGYPKEASSGFLSFFNTYPIQWVVYTTPPILLALALASLLFVKKFIMKKSFSLLLVLWLVTTIGRNSFFGALNYGGTRLFMEFVPPLTMLSGITAGHLVKTFSNKKYSILLSLLIFAAFIPTLIKLVKIHPNEGVYFNFLIGGLSGAKEKNLPSWGDSYGNAYYPALLWLNGHAERDAKISLPVANTSNIPRFKLRPDLALSPNYWSGLNHNGEYLIELTYDYGPMNWFALKYLNEAMVSLYEVKVDGVPIAKVWKNDQSFIKEAYKKQEKITLLTVLDKNRNLLIISMPQEKKIMQVSISLPMKNCTPVKSGYIRTSIDDKNWVREPEDIARDQLNRAEPIGITPTFNFYFVGRRAKTIVIQAVNSNACLLLSKEAQVTFLAEN